MILETGNMFSIWGKTDLFCVTTNSTLTRYGELVMGRGIALELIKKYPQIGKLAGSQIENMGIYGLKTFELDRQKVGLFQVKTRWQDRAEIGLIAWSSAVLDDYVKRNKLGRVDINFPGIGAGRLKEEDVLKVIKFLPKKVHVWKMSSE